MKPTFYCYERKHVSDQLKGRGHNRLMSKFGAFFIFGQICLIFGM